MIPPEPNPPVPNQSDPLRRLLAIMARLRDPSGGCPWDLEQTFATIAPHTIEEAYEVVDAIERGDMPHLADELGDLLFQVVFYAQMGHESGHFDFDQICETICDKMVRRHPHVFGSADITSAEAQTQAWEAQKARERAAKAVGDAASTRDTASAIPSALDGIAQSLPALTRALKLQNRAARVNFDWPTVTPILAKLREELAEVEVEIEAGDHDKLEAELGDLMFVCVNLARKLLVEPETALRRANTKFERRFHHIEQTLAESNKAPQDCDLDSLDALWDDAKAKGL